MKPNLKIAPVARSEQRQILAAAIAKHDLAVRRLAANEQATETAQEQIFEARDAIAERQTAVDEANGLAAKHLVDVALGTPGEAPQTLRDASAALQEAKDELEAARAARALLESQHGALMQEIEWARSSVDRAIKGVVRSDGITIRLLREFDALNREMENRLHVLKFLDGKSMIADENRWRADPNRNDLAIVAPWEAAIAALATHPDEALPLSSS